MQETQTFWNINYSYGKGRRDDEFKCFIWIIKSLRGPYTSYFTLSYDFRGEIYEVVNPLFSGRHLREREHSEADVVKE